MEEATAILTLLSANATVTKLTADVRDVATRPDLALAWLHGDGCTGH